MDILVSSNLTKKIQIFCKNSAIPSKERSNVKGTNYHTKMLFLFNLFLKVGTEILTTILFFLGRFEDTKHNNLNRKVYYIPKLSPRCAIILISILLPVFSSYKPSSTRLLSSEILSRRQ